jgi:3-deoxy-D-manno-octulosonic-acid transferase
MESAQRGIPLVLVNGRLSERSFSRWRRAPGSIAALLRHFDMCLTQSVADAERYSELGALRVTMTGNLKLDVPAPPANDAEVAAIRHALSGRAIFAAASTHPGEEAVIVDAHRRLRGSFPGLITVLAPRHPERGLGVVDIAAVSGLNAVLRSQGRLPGHDTDVYIVDSIGELGLVYRLAPIVFMGGSLVRHGGQNPIEAAKLGAAILHGPHVWNFAEIYAALDEAHGAEQVSDGSKLALRIGTWLTDPGSRGTVADAALKTVDILGGALDRTLAAIDPYLMQFRLEHG